MFQSMDMLLSANDDDRALPLAIKCAVESKDPQLVKKLTHYLLGEGGKLKRNTDVIGSKHVHSL